MVNVSQEQAGTTSADRYLLSRCWNGVLPLAVAAALVAQVVAIRNTLAVVVIAAVIAVALKAVDERLPVVRR